MSNEVKTKEKVNMDPKYIIKLTVTLLLICMVVAGLLGWVNSITKDKIAAITWEKTVAAMQKVIEADDFSDAMELTDDMTAAATAQGGTLAAVYQAQSGGQPVGYAINVEASGSQGHHLHDGGYRHGSVLSPVFPLSPTLRPPVSAPRS